MNKRLWLVMILALGLALLTAGTAGAKVNFQDLSGNWAGSANVAFWNGDYGFEPVGVALSVDVQDANGMFYGTYTFGGNVEQMTGSIATNKIITIAIYAPGGGHGTFTGKLTGKTIKGTYNFFADGQIATTTVNLTKQ